jgi:hypothetical protein
MSDGSIGDIGIGKTLIVQRVRMRDDESLIMDEM